MTGALRNENILAFNHIGNDSEFQQGLLEFDTSLTLDQLYPDSEIFHPFEINDDSDHTVDMMTSSNGNLFRVTGHLCGEFTGPRL